MEQWKDIEEFKGLYQISNLGKVKSIERYKNNGRGMQLLPEKLKEVQIQPNGYHYVNLYVNNKNHTRRIHRLVATAFIPNTESKPDVNHIDGNKANNTINNLEWSTKKENIQHMIKSGYGANQYGKY